MLHKNTMTPDFLLMTERPLALTKPASAPAPTQTISPEDNSQITVQKDESVFSEPARFIEALWENETFSSLRKWSVDVAGEILGEDQAAAAENFVHDSLVGVEKTLRSGAETLVHSGETVWQAFFTDDTIVPSPSVAAPDLSFQILANPYRKYSLLDSEVPADSPYHFSSKVLAEPLVQEPASETVASFAQAAAWPIFEFDSSLDTNFMVEPLPLDFSDESSEEEKSSFPSPSHSTRLLSKTRAVSEPVKIKSAPIAETRAVVEQQKIAKKEETHCAHEASWNASLNLAHLEANTQDKLALAHVSETPSDAPAPLNFEVTGTQAKETVVVKNASADLLHDISLAIEAVRLNLGTQSSSRATIENTKAIPASKVSDLTHSNPLSLPKQVIALSPEKESASFLSNAEPAWSNSGTALRQTTQPALNLAELNERFLPAAGFYCARKTDQIRADQDSHSEQARLVEFWSRRQQRANHMENSGDSDHSSSHNQQDWMDILARNAASLRTLARAQETVEEILIEDEDYNHIVTDTLIII